MTAVLFPMLIQPARFPRCAVLRSATEKSAARTVAAEVVEPVARPNSARSVVHAYRNALRSAEAKSAEAMAVVEPVVPARRAVSVARMVCARAPLNVLESSAVTMGVEALVAPATLVRPASSACVLETVQETVSERTVETMAVVEAAVHVVRMLSASLGFASPDAQAIAWVNSVARMAAVGPVACALRERHATETESASLTVFQIVPGKHAVRMAATVFAGYVERASSARRVFASLVIVLATVPVKSVAAMDVVAFAAPASRGGSAKVGAAPTLVYPSVQEKHVAPMAAMVHAEIAGLVLHAISNRVYV